MVLSSVVLSSVVLSSVVLSSVVLSSVVLSSVVLSSVVLSTRGRSSRRCGVRRSAVTTGPEDKRDRNQPKEQVPTHQDLESPAVHKYVLLSFPGAGRQRRGPLMASCRSQVEGASQGPPDRPPVRDRHSEAVA